MFNGNQYLNLFQPTLLNLNPSTREYVLMVVGYANQSTNSDDGRQAHALRLPPHALPFAPFEPLGLARQDDERAVGGVPLEGLERCRGRGKITAQRPVIRMTCTVTVDQKIGVAGHDNLAETQIPA